jgi:hypothetical protein
MADITNRRNSYTFLDDESEREGSHKIASAPSASISNLVCEGWLDAYLDRLQRYPLQTKAITCSIISALGAILGNFYSSDPRLKHKKAESTTLQKVTEVISFAFYGGVVGGPMTHFWNQWLEDNDIMKSRHNKSWNMMLDQLVAQPPMLFLMHLILDMTGAALRELPRSWNRSIARTGPSAVLSWRFWPAAVYLM